MFFTIDGIPVNSTTEDLHAVLRTIANVNWVSVIRDPLGRSLRFAIGHAVDLMNAKKVVETLHGQTFLGQRLRASLLDESILDRTPRIRDLIAAQQPQFVA